MAASSPLTSPPALPLPPSGLVGRERERQRLGALLAAAAAGQGRLVLVGGDGGHRQDGPRPRPRRRGDRARRRRPDRWLLRPERHPALRPLARGAGLPAGWRRAPPAPRRADRRRRPGARRRGGALPPGLRRPRRASRRPGRWSSCWRTCTGPIRPASTCSASSAGRWPPSRCCWSPPTGPTS